jgi:G3E family GTPase
MARAKYIMLGGFLGAGKTTTLRALGKMLSDRGLRVGLITNDQARGLVDTALAAATGLPTEEIGGGCFCCRFNSLLEAARSLNGQNRPEVFLAEPVGSCTDLVATVSLPLQQIYGDDFEVAPYAALLDPIRAERLLGLQPGRQFSENVQYIYRKQLEEADHIVINKTDLLADDPARLPALETALRAAFPHARVWRVRSRSGEGLEPLLDTLLAETMDRDGAHPMPLDYQVYGDGEARLGWLNASAKLTSDDEWDGNTWLLGLAKALQTNLEAAGAEVAHLKMLLSLAEDAYELAAVNQTRSESTPELSHRLADALEDGHLLINCRAEADPELLRKIVQSTLESHLGGLRAEWESLDYFRPGMPTPTHQPKRLTDERRRQR